MVFFKLVCRNILAVSLCGLLVSCNGFKIWIPEDESTAEEREKIAATLQHISALAAEVGYQNSFTSLPVWVTTEDEYENNRSAYCSWDDNNHGVYIVINRKVFEREKQEPRFQEVFAVLLHEIGHCYFSRGHSHERILKPGYIAEVQAVDSVGGTVFNESGFPVSIMYVGSPASCQENCDASFRITKVKEFEKYFVSELVGTIKAMSADELEKFKSFRWVKIEE
ncbi:hypothetical protein [Bdellovibrio sp. HCB337]|uniref:hypothetical protein n=1 Tax=Bdellovibrio sp. HCB337 TaxID=3394358 RepID=UPI0039A71BB6